MNKKSFILLPALMMILASCGGNTSESTSEEKPSSEDVSNSVSETSSGGTSSDVNYGTADNPLTVASFNTEVAKLGLTAESKFSTEHFYVKGLATTAPTFNSKYSSYAFSLADSKDADAITVSGAKLDENVDEPYQNDTVLVYGLAEFYNDKYCIYFTDTDSPAIKSVTRGSSTVTSEIEHGSITGLEGTYTNGATATFTVTADSGYKVSTVKAGSSTLTEADGKYSFVVKGDTKVVVSIVDESSTEKEANIPLNGKLFTLSSDNKTATYATEGVSFTLDKNTSTTNIRLKDEDHIRIYKDAKFTIKLDGTIKKIKFTSKPKYQSDDYYSYLVGATFTGGSVDKDSSSEEDLSVYINADANVSEISFVAAAGQVRLTNAVITYEPAA